MSHIDSYHDNTSRYRFEVNFLGVLVGYILMGLAGEMRGKRHLVRSIFFLPFHIESLARVSKKRETTLRTTG